MAFSKTAGGGGGGGVVYSTACINDWRTGGEEQHWCIGASRKAGNIGNGGSPVLCCAARAGRVWRVLREDLVLLGSRRFLAQITSPAAIIADGPHRGRRTFSTVVVIDVTTIDVAPSCCRRSPTTSAALLSPLTDHFIASAVHRGAVPSVQPSKRRAHPRCVPWACLGVFHREWHSPDGSGSTPCAVAPLYVFLIIPEAAL